MRQEIVERGQAMYIFQCEDSLDGIFTAVYDAWDSGYGLMNVRIEVLNGRDDCYNMELFSEYQNLYSTSILRTHIWDHVSHVFKGSKMLCLSSQKKEKKSNSTFRGLLKDVKRKGS